MRTFARVLGMVMMANGAFDFAFPEAAISYWTKGPGKHSKSWLARMAREYRCLSPDARRFIAGYEFLAGAVMTYVASQPTAAEAAEAEWGASERRLAALLSR